MRNCVPLSIIIPCLNESGEITAALEALAPLRGAGAEIVVVDGGSSDGTLGLARSGADVVLSAPRGRARQMNAGAARARGNVLLFLHADSRLPRDAYRLVLDALQASGRRWGRFDVAITGRHPMLRIIAVFMNWRSRLTSIATGDQAIFVTRELFEKVGRFPEIALMEDVALTATLRRFGRPLCLQARVTTSGRRWEEHGVVKTVFLMWRLRLAYRLGASPDQLAKRYVPHRSP
jgi:rSAM/selenodomain-associated transferase 2